MFGSSLLLFAGFAGPAERVRQVFASSPNSEDGIGEPNTGDGDGRVRLFGTPAAENGGCPHGAGDPETCDACDVEIRFADVADDDTGVWI